MRSRNISFKPDYDTSAERYDAFWHCDVIDRPPVNIYLAKEKRVPVPAGKHYDSYAEKWLDIEYRADCMSANAENTLFYADAMPTLWPNMGPEIFSAWCGCRMDYTADTTWAVPCIEDWAANSGKCVFDMQNHLFKMTEKFTDLLIERGKGKFIVGLTDFHGGGDHIAALRDPQNLALDLIYEPDNVKTMLEQAEADFRKAYEHFEKKLFENDMPLSTWMPSLISDERFYVPSNDFSCMVSNKMFEEFFLPGIADECRYFTNSIYHLDGPQALRYLDYLLEIKELNAIQYVPTAGKDGFGDLVPIYQRIQAGGKGVYVMCCADDIDLLIESLKPQGLFIAELRGIRSKEHADEFLKRLENWR